MAEIPIERKEGRNWLPLILGLLALLAILGFCFTRRGAETAARPADSASTSGTAAGGTASGAVAGPVPADSAAATNTGGAPAVAGATAGGANGLIEQFTTFVQTRDTTQETEGNHVYTAEGTSRLAAALDGIAGGSPNISVYADSMRRSIQRLRTSGAQDVHADDAKAAFSAAVSAMEQINRARGRNTDVAQMRAIYNELSSQRPLLPQLGTVDRFFKASAQALQQMRS
jgi:hypothetical protein